MHYICTSVLRFSELCNPNMVIGASGYDIEKYCFLFVWKRVELVEMLTEMIHMRIHSRIHSWRGKRKSMVAFYLRRWERIGSVDR